MAGTKDAGWADGTPDDGGGEEDFGSRAGEGEGLLIRTDVWDVAESPVEHCDLDN